MSGSLKVRELFKKYGVEVDETLRSVFKSQDDSLEMYGHMAYFMGFADETLQPVHIYGGKRFRSSLCLMLADWLGDKKSAAAVASAIELFHNFTLIHDDIVDGDTFRRGRKTVWNIWGKDQAINSGDGQLLMVYRVLEEDKTLPLDRKIIVQEFLTQQYLRVVEGQYLDFTLTEAKLGDSRVTEEMYFKMIGRKTADLIAAATKAAGIVLDVSGEVQQSLFDYGYNLGLAYQICDDTISIWGTSEQTGKRVCGDVFERKKTLPILYAYKKLSEEEQSQLLNFYNETEAMKEEEAEKIVSLLDGVQTYEYMMESVQSYAEKAKDAAKQLPLTEMQQKTLSEVVDMLLPDIKKF